MSEMVERVARAICTADGCDPDAIGYGMGVLMPDGTKYPLWCAHVKRAEAAIAAMREPTIEMDLAGCSHSPGVWRTMIDEALKP